MEYFITIPYTEAKPKLPSSNAATSKRADTEDENEIDLVGDDDAGDTIVDVHTSLAPMNVQPDENEISLDE